MRNLARRFSLPPIALAVPETLEDALAQCAQGESPPEVALLQLLVVSPSEQEGERALGTAIWDALESREGPVAERLGAMHQLWEGARRIVHATFK